MIFSSISKVGINNVSKRFLRKKINMKSWPNDWVPFHWSRPEKVPGYYDNADLVDLDDPAPKALRPEVRMSEELNRLEENNPLRKIFSLEHAKRSLHNKAFVQEQLKKLGLIHQIDYPNSLEAKIINLTYTLRHAIETIDREGADEKFNSHIRNFANSVKYRRYRYLCDLKEQHGDRYERLKKALNIEPKNNLINVPYLRPYRKKQMRQLAIEYSRDLKEKKVEEFMKSLEEEKVEFENHKKNTMKWIEEQEKKLGVTV